MGNLGNQLALGQQELQKSHNTRACRLCNAHLGWNMEPQSWRCEIAGMSTEPLQPHDEIRYINMNVEFEITKPIKSDEWWLLPSNKALNQSLKLAIRLHMKNTNVLQSCQLPRKVAWSRWRLTELSPLPIMKRQQLCSSSQLQPAVLSDTYQSLWPAPASN